MFIPAGLVQINPNNIRTISDMVWAKQVMINNIIIVFIIVQQKEISNLSYGCTV